MKKKLSEEEVKEIAEAYKYFQKVSKTVKGKFIIWHDREILEESYDEHKKDS